VAFWDTFGGFHVKNAIEASHVPRLSDAAVQAKTGKTWQEWFAVLDAAGARAMDHQSIAAYSYQQLRLPGWWAQMVTVAYEQARGRSRPGLTVPRTHLQQICYNPAACPVRQVCVPGACSAHGGERS
jgi:hypothetical protein